MTTARELLDAAVSERECQDQIVAYAKLRGWAVYHTFDSRRSESGFPDLILAREGRVIAIEVKSQKGKLTLTQRAWVDALNGTITSLVARPSDWPEVEKVLA